MKDAAYKGLVRPVLECGSCVWDPHGVVLQEFKKWKKFDIGLLGF